MSQGEAIVHTMDVDLSERHMVAGCSDGMVRLYSIADSKFSELVELPGHGGPVTRAVFAHHGEYIISADFSGRVIMWKIENGAFSKKVDRQLLEGPIYDVAVRYKDGYLHIFCACDGGHLKTLHVDPALNCEEESKEVHRYGVSAVSCNEECVVTSGFDFSVILHMKDGTETFNNHQAAVSAVAVAPVNHVDKLVFASCSEDGKVAIIERKGEKFSTQIVEAGEPCLSMSWNRTGLILTVGLESGNFKSYILGMSGEYEEVETVEHQK